MRIYALIFAGVAFFTVACTSNDRTLATSVPAGNSRPASGGDVNSTTTVTESPSPAAAQLTVADLEDRMRRMGPTAESMQKHLTEKRLTDVAKEAQDIAMLLGDVEKFWTQNVRPDAVLFAQQARQAATQTAGAAAAGDGMTAQTAATRLINTCRMCHDAYRESDGTGGFHIRKGIVR